MKQELERIALNYKLNFLPWGIKGGKSWLWYKQIDEKDYKVQVSTRDNYDIYIEKSNRK
ncbi:hypothetical protein RBH29_11155 [Herbivorax sp. ANBcel31]|uniref:hypothetical protein n=1 Tax=Herbivorax sp. ANBcel31 TaxID=3069754 RepID=UPI0027B28C66|nr:hypothetical protein [Herbivorax sp. ANBcel31]MDQ2086985.1 hypothetical protein [Herbivorax sp. ANBcel31]